MDAILTVANGDMRKAVTTLQSVHHFYGKSKALDADAIREISGDVPEATLMNLWGAIASASFEKLEVGQVG